MIKNIGLNVTEEKRFRKKRHKAEVEVIVSLDTTQKNDLFELIWESQYYDDYFCFI